MARLTKQQFRELRESLNWTQQELARAMRMGKDGRRTIRRWEGEPTAAAKKEAASRGVVLMQEIPGPAEIALRALAGQDLSEFRALAKSGGADGAGGDQDD